MAYSARRSGLDLSPKRYRYTTKERDEETGFDYFGARYYMPWLGRWLSADPAGFVDGPNLCQYVRGRTPTLLDRHGNGPPEELIGSICTITRQVDGKTEVYISQAKDFAERLGSKHPAFDLLSDPRSEVKIRKVYGTLDAAASSQGTIGSASSLLT